MCNRDEKRVKREGDWVLLAFMIVKVYGAWTTDYLKLIISV